LLPYYQNFITITSKKIIAEFMDKFMLFASPWWVNLLVLIPLIAYCFWRKKGLKISPKTLLLTALFGVVFGFIESSTLVYLRAAIELFHGYSGSFSDIARFTSEIYQQNQVIGELPRNLMTLEIFREAATMIMLVCLAFLAVKSYRERLALFLWTFAVWDIFYYFGFWATIRWPSSPLTPDVLFLIPVPWFSQVWHPVLLATKKDKKSL